MTLTAAPDQVTRPAIAASEWLYVPAASRDHQLVLDRLAACGLVATPAATVSDALHRMAQDAFGLCLIDLADDRAAATVRTIRSRYPGALTAGVIDPRRPVVAAEALDAGLRDVLPWPFEPHDVAAIVASGADHLGHGPRVEADRSQTPKPSGAALVTSAPSMRIVADQIRAAAESRGGVLVSGEPGTGRGDVARAVHAESAKRDGPFVEVDCEGGSIDELETRLFGLGSTGRVDAHGKTRGPDRIGRAGALARASGGTLFLMNLVEAPARVQAKLARLLRDREALLIERKTLVSLDLRALAGVSPLVDTDVVEGRLRRDLYERFAQVRIDVPALRRRREDIPLLAVAHLQDSARPEGTAVPKISRSALALLSALPWPGNWRELRALLDTLVQTRRPIIQIEDVLDHVQLEGLSTRVDASGTLRDAKTRFERDWISAVLVKHHGRVGEAARALGIQRTNLYRKVRQLNVARTLLAPRKNP